MEMAGKRKATETSKEQAERAQPHTQPVEEKNENNKKQESSKLQCSKIHPQVALHWNDTSQL